MYWRVGKTKKKKKIFTWYQLSFFFFLLSPPLSFSTFFIYFTIVQFQKFFPNFLVFFRFFPPPSSTPVVIAERNPISIEIQTDVETDSLGCRTKLLTDGFSLDSLPAIRDGRWMVRALFEFGHREV